MFPKVATTPMQLFLAEVEGTSYGGVLREINAFLHHRKDADDDFLRRQKDKSQKYVADSYQLSESITSEFIGHLMEGLKARIKYVCFRACRFLACFFTICSGCSFTSLLVAFFLVHTLLLFQRKTEHKTCSPISCHSSPLAPQATFEGNSADNIKKEYTVGFTPINKATEDDKKGFEVMNNNIVNEDFFTLLNGWLLIEFRNYQETTKRQRDKLHHRLGRLESENFKRYKETLASDEEGLLRLFYKLRDSEVSSNHCYCRMNVLEDDADQLLVGNCCPNR
jgi:hypothetical protein